MPVKNSLYSCIFTAYVVLLNLQRIVMSVISMMCGFLRGAILPHTLDKQTPDRSLYVWPTLRGDVLSDWLTHSLLYVRSAYSLLIGLDLPSEVLDTVAKLVFDLR